MKSKGVKFYQKRLVFFEDYNMEVLLRFWVIWFLGSFRRLVALLLFCLACLCKCGPVSKRERSHLRKIETSVYDTECSSEWYVLLNANTICFKCNWRVLFLARPYLIWDIAKNRVCWTRLTLFVAHFIMWITHAKVSQANQVNLWNRTGQQTNQTVQED